MMRFQAGRLSLMFGPLLLLAACGGGVQHATRDLGDRLQTRLAPDVAAGQVSLQPLPEGARVTLPDPVAYWNDRAELGARDSDVLASVIESLLDPSLMRVEVADAAATPDSPRAIRVDNVKQYFVDYGLGLVLQPDAASPGLPPGPTGSPPAGLAITINVQCPQHARWTGLGYGSGQKEPAC